MSTGPSVFGPPCAVLTEVSDLPLVDTVTVARRGDVAQSGGREFGIDAGRFEVPDDFDGPLGQEELELFEQ
jgi:hypothetical protein